MEEANVLSSDNVNQPASFHVPYFDEAGLKGEEVRVRESEGGWLPFPCDLPVGSCAPSISVNEEGEIRIIQQELAI